MKNLLIVCALLTSTASYALTFSVKESGTAIIKDVNVDGASETSVTIDLISAGVGGTKNEDIAPITAIGEKIAIGRVADAQQITLNGEDLKNINTITGIINEILSNKVLAIQEGMTLVKSDITYSFSGCNTSTKKKLFSKKTTTTECSVGFARRSTYEIK